MTPEEKAKLWAELDAEYEAFIAARKYCFDMGEKCALEIKLCCRTCENPDVELVDVAPDEREERDRMFPQFKGMPCASHSPLWAYRCNECERLTMVSEAFYCTKCGACLFRQSMDEDIFGDEEE